MSITLVTHCWAPPEFAFYADALRVQLWSLNRYPPDTLCSVCVCHDPEDKETVTAIKAYQWNGPETINIVPYPMERGELFRRSIARNRIGKALHPSADAMLLLDADMAFGEGCLTKLTSIIRAGQLPVLSTPTFHLISKDHATGDALLASVRAGNEPRLDPENFVPKRHRTTLGGLMIMRRDAALEGYLDERLWQKPSDPDKGFAEFLCDTTHRRRMAGKGREWIRIDLPNWFRVRHSRSSLNPSGDPSRYRLK